MELIKALMVNVDSLILYGTEAEPTPSSSFLQILFRRHFPSQTLSNSCCEMDMPDSGAFCKGSTPIQENLSSFCERYPTEKIRLPISGINLSGTWQHLDFYSRRLNWKVLSMLSSHHLPYAKTTGCFLVVVPLLAFCIRCIMDAFLNRNDGVGKLQAMNEQNVDNHGSKSRWKLALSDLRDPDAPDTDHSRQDIDLFPDNEEHFESENISQAYTKLENDYQKFLSECGISKCGYWRGGSPQ